MNSLIFSLITFIIIYLLYVIFVINKKKKLEKFKTSVYVTYLINVSKLDIKKVNIKVLAHIIALTNAFILSVTLFIIDFIDNIYLKFILGFIVVLILLFMMYFIIGKMYQKSGQTKSK